MQIKVINFVNTYYWVILVHTIDLKNAGYRTDLAIEKDNGKTNSNYISYGDVSVDKREISGKRYISISFSDITDKDNYKNVEKVFIKELKEVIGSLKGKKILIVGLGNRKSTPDALGPGVVNNILVTRHLFELGEVEEGYANVCSIAPGVTGTTGIETLDFIKQLVQFLEVDLVIIVDALAAKGIERVNKIIQITDAGISPGSGVGNYRTEISSDKLGIPVIAIGVPTIVEASVIVADTFNYMLKHFSYKLENVDNPKLKLVREVDQDYSKQDINLSVEDREKILGMVGNLSDLELEQLFREVLKPINYNLMVTPKEVDFIIERLSLLIGNGINKSLHESFNPTN